LVTLYPAHIEKEDKRFFYPCLEYFSREEQDKMLAEFWEFDRKMIHEKYQNVIASWEKNKNISINSLILMYNDWA
jgi:hemerythrin-like domain-containing protein